MSILIFLRGNRKVLIFHDNRVIPLETIGVSDFRSRYDEGWQEVNRHFSGWWTQSFIENREFRERCKNIKVKEKRERGIERKKDTKEESSALSILIYGPDFRRLCLSDKVVHADAAPAPMDGYSSYSFVAFSSSSSSPFCGLFLS